MAELAAADTCVTPVLSVDELVDDDQFGARHAFVDAVAAPEPVRAVRFRQVAPVLAGMQLPDEPVAVRRPAPVRHRPAAGRGGTDTIAHRRSTGTGDRGVSAIGIDDIDGLIGVEQYEEEGEFPVERGYVWTTCSSVENGNPIFWDDEVAEAVTGGPIAPPTMVSVWFRPHHWAPGRDTGGTAPAGALRPEGGPGPTRGGDERQHHRLPRAGPARDRLVTRQILRSVSDEKTTKLGTGRFWVIDVEYRNQGGELVAVESYTGFGYRRAGAPSRTGARS